MRFSRFLLIFIFLSNISLYADGWQIIDEYRFLETGSTINSHIKYRAISCADINNCNAIGNLNWDFPWNRMTTDGGQTWTTTLMDTVLRDGNGNLLYLPSKISSVFYPDTNLCFVLGDSNFYWRSTDRCRSWTKYKLDAIYKENQVIIYYMDMWDSKNGALITPFELFQTSDGGISWFKPVINIADSVLPVCYTSIATPEKDIIIALAYRKELGMYIIRSEDNGKNWTKCPKTPRWISSIQFLNKMNGWGVGSEFVEKKGTKDIITRTTDGGETWEIQLDTLASVAFGLFGLKMKDDSFGIAIGDGFKMWTTNDGGRHWIKDSSFAKNGYYDYFIDISILKNKTVFGITNDRGYIYKKDYSLTDVGEVINQNELKDYLLYPVPADGVVICKIPFNMPDYFENFNVEIYDILGNLVSKKENLDIELSHNTSLNIVWDCRNAQNGMYYLLIQTNNSKRRIPILI